MGQLFPTLRLNFTELLGKMTRLPTEILNPKKIRRSNAQVIFRPTGRCLYIAFSKVALRRSLKIVCVFFRFYDTALITGAYWKSFDFRLLFLWSEEPYQAVLLQILSQFCTFVRSKIRLQTETQLSSFGYPINGGHASLETQHGSLRFETLAFDTLFPFYFFVYF